MAEVKHAHGRFIHSHEGGDKKHPHRWVTLADPEYGIEAENPAGSYEEFMKLLGTGGTRKGTGKPGGL